MQQTSSNQQHVYKYAITFTLMKYFIHTTITVDYYTYMYYFTKVLIWEISLRYPNIWF